VTYYPEVKVTWLRMRIANAELAYTGESPGRIPEPIPIAGKLTY